MLYSMICCEKCGKELPFFYTTVDYMVKTAKSQGWKVSSDGEYESYCPECSLELEEIEKPVE